jgi:predicted  nucleic acid-binding Zn-ribbon protein
MVVSKWSFRIGISIHVGNDTHHPGAKMPRPPRHPSDLDLLNAVRAQLADDPDISQTELRARIGGTTTVVAAAMHAVYVETGRTNLGDGPELDPRFAALIRIPEPPPPLDLRTAVPAKLSQAVTDHLMALTGVVDDVITRVHEAALGAMRSESDAAKARIDASERRALRAETFVDSLRCEVAEASAETERVRTAAARDQGTRELELARLTREMTDARAAREHVEDQLKATIAELDGTRRALTTAHDERVVMARELAASNARAQELERQVTALNSRLDRTDSDLAAARAAESEARAEAAGAIAKLQVHDAMLGSGAVRAHAGRSARSRSRSASATDAKP